MKRLSLSRFKEPVLLDAFEAYELWAETYDQCAENALLHAEQSTIVPMLKRLKLKGKVILDAGCGTGRYLNFLHPYKPRILAGIDLSPAMIERAQKKITENTFVRLEVASIDNIPFKSGFFDVVICTLALDHLENLRRGVDELSRVLKRNGTAIISVFHPYGKLLGWKRTFKPNGNHQLHAVRYYGHRHSDYFEAFKSAGLRVDELLEPVIDERLKPFYERSDRLDLFEQFKGYPLLLIFRLAKL